jgi:cytoskeletal protein CcmA (bactofilin family)
MSFNASQKNTPVNAGSHASIDAPSRSYLGVTMVINGKITSDEFLTVDGKVKGNINISKTLTIGKSGYVEGEIKAEEVRIEGKVEGSIDASNKLKITSHGNFSGNVKSEKLVIEEGAVFKGKINIDDH